MSDQFSPNYESTLEADIERLAAEIKGRRDRSGTEGASEKELVKEAIRSFPTFERSAGAPGGVSVPPLARPSGASPASPLPDYAQNAPAEVKLEIEYLMDLALKDGLAKALSEAKRSPYFVQDALHDALAGRLYPELQKRGIVK